MAEPLGLALGTIALASLFSTCVELVDYFELGKSYEYDYSVACLKLSLLRARLDSWGDALSVRDAGHEAEELRRQWSKEQAVISESLLGIKNIFGNAELLKDKYSLIPRKSNAILHVPVARSKSAAALEQRTSLHQLNTYRRFSLFRRSTRWAIRDKERFDVLLNDLEFFISNLEHVLSRINMSQRSKRKPQGSTSSEPSSEGSNMACDENISGKAQQQSHAGTIFQDNKNHSEEVRGESVVGSNKDGRSWTQKGNDFKIGKASHQALYIQGVQGRATIPPANPDERNSYTVGQMRDQALGMQGFNSQQSIRDVLENRRAMFEAKNASVKSGQSSIEEQRSTESTKSSSFRQL